MMVEYFMLGARTSEARCTLRAATDLVHLFIYSGSFYQYCILNDFV